MTTFQKQVRQRRQNTRSHWPQGHLHCGRPLDGPMCAAAVAGGSSRTTCGPFDERLQMEICISNRERAFAQIIC